MIAEEDLKAMDKMSVLMLILVGLQLVSIETNTLAQSNVRATSPMHTENEMATAEPYVSPSVTMEATAESYVFPSATMETTAESYVFPSATMETTAESYVSLSATVKAITEPYVFPSATTEAMIETLMSPAAKIEATTKMNRFPAATADLTTEQTKSPTALITIAPVTEHQDDHASLKRPKEVTMVTAKETDAQTLKPLTTTTALATTISDTNTSIRKSTKSHDPGRPVTATPDVSMTKDIIQVSMSEEMPFGKDQFTFSNLI